MEVILIFLCGAIGALVIVYAIFTRQSSKFNFDESAIFMRGLIETSDVSQTSYRNILEAFREFKMMNYKDKKKYDELISAFVKKYDIFVNENIGKN